MLFARSSFFLSSARLYKAQVRELSILIFVAAIEKNINSIILQILQDDLTEVIYRRVLNGYGLSEGSNVSYCVRLIFMLINRISC